MNFKFNLGTEIQFGRGCVRESSSLFTTLGKKALIVTGKMSAVASGALEDTITALNNAGIGYDIFNKVENNPSLENVYEGGKFARSSKADFIIGIGGGSPLDASKAIAVLAVNDMDPIELYKNSFRVNPLPIVAIPTTAGTGSEVTPYSILTRKDMQTKMSFGNQTTFPRLALLDPSYTESLPYEVTANTAVDAFSHAVEGYLSRRSMPVSDILAIAAIDEFGKCIEALIAKNISSVIREKLLYLSMLGGMVIAHTGTTIVHGMGYSLTYFKGIPHGKANGVLLKEYFLYNYGTVKEKIDNILRLLNMKSIDEFHACMEKLLGSCGQFSEEELRLYASLAVKQRSTGYNARVAREQDLYEMLRQSLVMK